MTSHWTSIFKRKIARSHTLLKTIAMKGMRAAQLHNASMLMISHTCISTNCIQFHILRTLSCKFGRCLRNRGNCFSCKTCTSFNSFSNNMQICISSPRITRGRGLCSSKSMICRSGAGSAATTGRSRLRINRCRCSFKTMTCRTHSSISSTTNRSHIRRSVRCSVFLRFHIDRFQTHHV